MEEGLVCMLKYSFEILSKKCVANSCSRAAMGRKRFAVLCRMLFIVSKESQGLEEEDWTSEA